MPAIELKPADRKQKRGEAHHLEPVVLIGNAGLTPAVQKEVDAALNAHGLVKVRAASGSREERAAMLAVLAEALDAAAVQHIGRLLVLWRPVPARAPAVRTDRMPGPRQVKLISFPKSGNHRPQVRKVKVLGNQRVTAGGIVKRSKGRSSVSTKKRAQG